MTWVSLRPTPLVYNDPEIYGSRQTSPPLTRFLPTAGCRDEASLSFRREIRSHSLAPIRRPARFQYGKDEYYAKATARKPLRAVLGIFVHIPHNERVVVLPSGGRRAVMDCASSTEHEEARAPEFPSDQLPKMLKRHALVKHAMISTSSGLL